MPISRRTLGAAGSAGILSILAHSVARAQVALTDPASLVSPEYADIVPLLRQLANSPPLSGQTLAERRKPIPGIPTPSPAPTPPIVERRVPGGPAQPDVPVYVINPGGSGRPAILHTHGGGFVLGSARDILRSLQDLSLALDCVIVTVDYRLAPETKFPGSLEDNYAGLTWLYANADALGVDRRRIAVLGESAGGGHAAMLAIAARDRGEVPLIFQALIYPMLDDRTGSTRQPPSHVGRLAWRAADNVFGWSALLGVPAGSKKVPAGSVPARVENLVGLPPAFIAVGSIDLFVEEDIEYAHRLIQSDVAVELHVYPGATHGFDITDTETTRQFRSALRRALKNAFEYAKG